MITIKDPLSPTKLNFQTSEMGSKILLDTSGGTETAIGLNVDKFMMFLNNNSTKGS